MHAVQVMGANIELWKYRLYANETLYLEEVYRQTMQSSPEPAMGKNPVMVKAVKKPQRHGQQAFTPLRSTWKGKAI